MTKEDLKFIGIVTVLGVVFGFALKAFSSNPHNDMSQAVFRLTSELKQGGGTGFVIKAKSNKAVTVTNWHVCQIKTSEFLYAERDNEFKDVKIKILEEDAAHDLCILEPAPGKALTPGDKPVRFVPLYVTGYPFLRVLAPAQGLYNGEVEDQLGFSFPPEGCPKGFEVRANVFSLYCLGKFVLGDTTVPIFPGNSGSPITDKDARVVGVINSTNQQTGYGSFIPIRFLKELLEKY